MPDGPRRAAIAAAGVLLAAVAFGGGWVAGRRALPPPPPAPEFLNPLRDAARGELLVLVDGAGTRTSFRVLEAAPVSVLLEVMTQGRDGATSRREIRVARTYLGGFLVLEGEVGGDEREAMVRDLVVDRVVPDTIEATGRTLACWRVEGRHAALGEIRIWLSDALPVHGVARIESSRHRMEAESAEWPR